jgi:adenylate cyclase
MTRDVARSSAPPGSPSLAPRSVAPSAGEEDEVPEPQRASSVLPDAPVPERAPSVTPEPPQETAPPPPQETAPPPAQETAPPLAPETTPPLTTVDKRPDHDFVEELGREILAAERFRATLLAVIPTLVLFALVIARSAYPEVVAGILHGSVDIAPVGFFLMVVAAFEFYLVLRTVRVLRQQAKPSTPRRYVYAFIETSLPTAVILYYSTIDGPVVALLMPASFIYFVFILLSTLRLDFALSAFTGFVAAAEYAAVALLWAAHDATVAERPLASLPHHLGKAAILLVSGIAAGFVARRLRRSFTRAIESFGERQRILGVFGQHVSPEVAQRLVAPDAEIRTQACDVCVMFLDIRNFTAFAEGRSPAQVVDYLNVVFESTIDAIVSRHGIVNKFLGDGFMAVFEARSPKDKICQAAVDAALEIVARVDRLVVEGKIAPTKVGIGLHAGKAVVGNIGSALRKEYTVIGDVVNVAARIESLNKDLGTQILASEEVWLACDRPELEAAARDAITIRGRQQKVHVWQLA